jgi:hypothetical protein
MWSKMYIGLHVQYLLFSSNFHETWIFSTDFLKYSNIKLHEKPSSGSRGVPCGQINWRTDMNDENIVAFRNFAKAPKHCSRFFLLKLFPCLEQYYTEKQNFTVVVQWILYVLFICIMILLLHVSILQVFLRNIILFQWKLFQENKLFRSNTAPCYDPEHCGIQVYVIAMPGQLGHYSNVATDWTYEESFSIPTRE